jgi:release factor glutamine methyltransferase
VRDRFREAGLATPELDARLLAQAAFDIDAMALIRRERDVLPEEWRVALERFAQRRLAGEPVSRIIGRREFWGLDFELNSATLDPRPETEMLVADLVAFGQSRPELHFIDLGTGSGAIAIAALAALPRATGYAVDISAEALDMARLNARRHGVEDRLTLLQGSWWQAVPPELTFDVIVSNPPYIASASILGLAPEVRVFDPQAALDGGFDGLDAYRQIAAQAARRLRPGGIFLLEIGATQGEIVAKMVNRAGFSKVEVLRDLAGLDRVVAATNEPGR